MIKFFRKIRQNLLTENKTGKYFKYAFGEIILVVIGILIALGINNWNENRVLKNSAEQTLLVIGQNIEDDLIQLQEQKSFMDSLLYHTTDLNQQFQTNKNINDRTILYLIELNFERRIAINGNTFQTLNDNGEFSSLDKEIQKYLTAYYFSIEKAKEREQITNDFIQQNYQPYFLKEYNSSMMDKNNSWQNMKEYLKNDPRNAESLNNDTFLNDRYLESLVFSRHYQIKLQRERYIEAIEQGEKVLDYLEMEYN
tara:strand:+ start:127 stop:888 length:762 start_codon:yes stop_codon:yes gene_type:complete